jgi:hypothetical protein
MSEYSEIKAWILFHAGEYELDSDLPLAALERMRRDEEHYLHIRSECDEALHVRDLAREASQRDLAARRAAEAELADIINNAKYRTHSDAAWMRKVDQLRADLAEALEALNLAQRAMGEYTSSFASQKARPRAAAVLAKHRR